MMERFEEMEPALQKSLGYPMFVKPANTGSSVGVGKARDRAGLKAALQEVGDACRVKQLGIHRNRGEAGQGVDLVEDHTAIDLYIPARIPEPVSKVIRQTACDAFAAMGCTGLSRIDFFRVP